MKRILIVGGTGYIGTHMTHYLRSEGLHLTVTGRSESSPFPDEVKYVNIDVNKDDAFDDIELEEFDVIYYLAARTGVKDSFREYKDFLNVNFISTVRLLEKLRILNSPPLVVFVSSRLVYKGSEKKILNEDSMLLSKSIYALSKASAEEAFNLYFRVYGVKSFILRIGVPYGNLFGDSYSYGTLGFMYRSIIDKGVIPIYGNGLQRRTFTHINDLCYQLFQLSTLESFDKRIFNAIGEDFSILELARIFAKSKSGKIKQIEWPMFDSIIESGSTVFCSENLRNEIGDNLNYSLNMWIRSNKY